MLLKYGFCLFYLIYVVLLKFCLKPGASNPNVLQRIRLGTVCLPLWTLHFLVLLFLQHPQLDCKLCCRTLCSKHVALFPYDILSCISLQFLEFVVIVIRSFENVAKFKHLGMTITNQTSIHEEIKSRVNLVTIQFRTFCLLLSCLKT
jgi:hypothetical protein